MTNPPVDDPCLRILPEPDPASAPAEGETRWEPLRSGLLNLFKYDNEVFPFHRGRLLLRGNNGAGKSRVLALQLPFLLDGDAHAHRVEPDGDANKHMIWHLLMDGKYEHRIGYTWIEFGRRGADGAPLYQTLGCGLHASTGSQLDHWFFITKQRIGPELDLAPGRQVLSRDRLREAIGAQGMVYTKGEEYRRAVNDHLFGLDETRYNALLDLLIQLRRPQLSRKLDEENLTGTLSGALSPMPSAVLKDVADGYEEVERDRASLAAYQASLDAMIRFDACYARYMKVAVARRAETVRRAQNDFETTRDHRREADRVLASATARKDAAEAVRKRLELERAKLSGELRALENDPAMKDAKDLNHARERADEAEAHAKRTADAARTAAEATDRYGEEMKSIATRLEKTDDEAAHALDNVRDAAGGIGVPMPFEGIPADNAEAQRVLGDLRREMNRRREQWKGLRERERKVAALKGECQTATRLRTDQDGRTALARDHAADMDAQFEAARAALLDASEAWLSNAPQHAVAGAEGWLEELAAWSEDPRQDNPLRRAADAAFERRAKALSDQMALIRVEKQGLAQKIDACEAERRTWMDMASPPPPAPAWRDAALRDQPDRPGIPFWRACDFQDDVPPQARAGLEAALEASGLLDAWIRPDGALLDVSGDVFWEMPSRAAVAGGGLKRWLRPALDPADAGARTVTADTVARVLAAVGAGPAVDAVAWVDVDGGWRHGVLTGKHAKQTAEYLGVAAREATRRKRLAELDGEIDALTARSESCSAALADREREREALSGEKARFPDDQPLRDARGIRIASGESLRKEEKLSEERLRAQQRAAEALERENGLFAEAMAALDFTGWADRLADFGEAWSTASGLLPPLESAWRTRRDAAVEHARSVQRHAESLVAKVQLEHDAKEASLSASQRRAELNTLEAAVGMTVRDIQRKLESVRRALGEQKEKVTRNITERESAIAEEGAAKARADTLLQDEKTRENTRDVRVADFRALAAAGMFAEVDSVDPEDLARASITRVVDAARDLRAVCPDKDLSDDVWDDVNNALNRGFDRLSTELSVQSWRAENVTVHDFNRVTVEINGEILRVGDARRLFEDEVRQRGEILTEAERQFIEKYLISEAAAVLGERIGKAREFVRDMNGQLEARGTSAGMTLRFTWTERDDEMPGCRAACRILERQQALRTAKENDDLADFLQDRIRTARREAEGEPWRECVRRAIDYRAWHQFRVERRQEGTWKRITKRTFGTGSGGEKALILTMPLCAAAAAHYLSTPLAPRLILLDEAFAGIDQEMRGKCMGLLKNFELNYVMTSESEWGCYPTVDGLSICQLITRPGAPVVLVERWTWDGHEITRDGAQSDSGLFAR